MPEKKEFATKDTPPADVTSKMDTADVVSKATGDTPTTKDVVHEVTSEQKRMAIRQHLVERQAEAKAGRLEGDIGLDDNYWKVREELQVKLQTLNETPDEKLDEFKE